jgi:hypothetical protein
MASEYDHVHDHVFNYWTNASWLKAWERLPLSDTFVCGLAVLLAGNWELGTGNLYESIRFWRMSARSFIKQAAGA